MSEVLKLLSGKFTVSEGATPNTLKFEVVDREDGFTAELSLSPVDVSLLVTFLRRWMTLGEIR